MSHDVTLTAHVTFRTGQLMDDQEAITEWRTKLADLVQEMRDHGPGNVVFTLTYQVDRVPRTGPPVRRS